ncbi:4-phosphoerythronate dehydrogenase PdxB [Pseudomonas sp. gcc21]|uniref:4-phosphoerythronate dehydrogenase PdxB n=1 Tax=Pseudomonas sp. gcc21 TaxID=2726989 RepID=UPI001451488A|nr:4-phosphoerythronate dehydrogenase PdxB [Pseudomonas sp. gcc21]QJD57877.1 4-phosphoerythronate dehydrogenase PdxB [Pseudomonas sp. gcc21]
MHIVADENIPLLDEFMSGFGRITRLPGRKIDASSVRHADVLLVRSVTKVTASMLAGSTVRFVGTCTIGTDHLDLHGLDKAGICVASAPGCNARGVVEYVLSCLLAFSERTGIDWQQQVVGIVGAGQVGGRLARTLRQLGVECLLCDPPRSEQESGFIGLDSLIERAGVISCHVPLTDSGRYPTRHLFNTDRLARLRSGAWLINSSRGPVIDNQALKALLEQRDDLQVALDVWEHEPLVDPELAALCALATPHIAGYSLDGKLRGTAQIYQALCQFLGEKPTVRLDDIAPSDGSGELRVSAGTSSAWLLARALRLVYDVRDDDARFRAMLGTADSDSEIRSGFDLLRKHYPLRRENSFYRVSMDAPMERPVADRLAAAGFRS